MSGVEIRVRSNSRQARNDLNKLENSVKNIETRTAAAGKAFRNLAIGIGAAFSGGVAIKGINNAADSLTNLENRIALVTGRGKDLDKTMNSLFKISKATRGDIGGSADTYNRFGIALKDAGKSSEELLKAVESVNKAVAISGSSAESAKGALVQLGQGLAAGALRGEELNSVLEAAPRLAQAIADEMEVPLGKIREIAQEGKLTTEVVFNALINQAGALTSEFETMQGTSDQAFNVMKDQISRVVAEISKGLGITDKFTERFNNISDSLETNREAIVSGVVGAFQSIGSLFSGIKTVALGTVAAVSQVVDYIKELVGLGSVKLSLISGGALDAAKDTLAIIVGFFAAIRLDSSIVTKALDKVAKFVTRIFSALGNYKSTALESIGRFSKVASDNFKELYKNAVRFSILKYAAFRGGQGILKDYANYLKLLRIQNNVEKSAKSLFQNTADYATKYLSKAWKSVKTFLNLIERKFYWVYDEVIQNSWWTDTMEQTYELAERWLGKAARSVGDFGNTVNKQFKGVFESFKKGAATLNGGLTLSNVKIKFGSIKDQLAGFTSGIKESATAGLKAAVDGLSQVSPIISASFGAALVAGVTRFLSPELFKKTFGKIGPAAIALLFAGIATDLAEVLKDAGIFSALGANLGTTLAIAFDAAMNAIPVLVDGLIQGLASAGKAFGRALEGSILGLPAKILSFIPGGGLITSIMYGAAGLAIFSKGFRKVMGGLITSAMGKSSSLTKGSGIISSLLFGENYTRASGLLDARIKKHGKKAGAGIAAIAQRAKIAHLGIMGVFAAGSVALFGGVVGPELSAMVGLVAGQVAASLALTNASFASVTARFAGLRAVVTATSVSTFASLSGAFKGAAVAANTAMTSMSATSKISAVSIASNFKTAAAVSGTAFLKFGKIARFSIAGIAASLLLTGAAFADVGEQGGVAADSFEGSGGTIADTLLNIGLAAVTVGSLLPSVGKKFTGLFKAIGKRATGTLAVSFGTAFSSIAATVTASTALVAAGTAAIYGTIAASVAAVGAIGAVSIYSLFFGEGDTFKQRLKSNTRAIKEAIFGIKRNITGVRSELNTLTSDIEKRLGKIDINVDISANLRNANLAGFTTNEQSDLDKRIADLGKLQQAANAEQAIYGNVSTGLLQQIKDSADAINETLLTQAGGKEGLADTNAATFDEVADSIAGAVRLSVIENSELFAGLLSGDAGKLRNAADPEFQNKVTAQAPENALLQTLNKFREPNALESDEQREAFAAQGLQAISLAGDAVGDSLKQFEAFLALLLSQNGVVTTEVQRALDALANQELFVQANPLTGSVGEVGAIPEKSLIEIERAAGSAAFQQALVLKNALVSELSGLLDSQGFSEVDNLNFLSNDALTEALVALRRVDTNIKQLSPENSENLDLGNMTSREIALELVAEGASSSEIAGLEVFRDKAEDAVQKIVETLKPLPEGFNTLNTSLANLNIPTLETSGAGSGFGSEPKALKDLNEGRELQLRLTKELRRVEESSNLSTVQRLVKTQELTTALEANRIKLSNYVELLNASNVSAAEVGQTLENSLNIDGYDFDVGKLLALKPQDLKGILTAQTEVEVLGIKLAQLAASGNLTNAVGETGAQINKALVDARKSLAENLVKLGVGTKNTSKSDTETVFEKFVGGLNNSGFAVDIDTAAKLSKSAILKMKAPLKAIEKAQKAIVNASLGDNKTRERSIRLIEQQRGAIADLLQQGTVSQAKVGLEALNIDSSVLDTNNPAALSLARSIADNQLKLDNTLLSDLDTRKQITAEMENQRRLLDGITSSAQNSTTAISDSIKQGLGDILTGATSIKDALFGVLDTISSKIISTVVDSFVESFFQASGLKSMFDGLFADLFSASDEIGSKKGGLLKGVLGGGKEDEAAGEDKSTKAIGGIFDGAKDWMSGLFGEGGGLSGIFEGFSGGLSGIFGGLSSSLGSLFGGGASGGGGGLGSLLSMGAGFLGIPGFSQGGTVPSTPFSQIGKDSVPAMLMPGEVVMSKSAVSRADNNQGSTQAFNINVQGDVSRQTRKEIVKMMPQIAGGVNMQNKENNYRR